MYVDGGVTGNILYGGRLRDQDTLAGVWAAAPLQHVRGRATQARSHHRGAFRRHAGGLGATEAGDIRGGDDAQLRSAVGRRAHSVNERNATVCIVDDDSIQVINGRHLHRCVLDPRPIHTD